MTSKSSLRYPSVLLIAVLVYCALAGVFLVRKCENLNPDGIAYIQNARHLLHGEWSAAVSGYWPPLVSWSIAPFLLAGMDAVHAAHCALALWGLVTVLAAYFFMRRFTPMPPAYCLGPMLVVATSTVYWLRYITPDIPVAAILMLYFGCVWHPQLCTSPKRQLAAGIVAGLAFFAKAYVLPFFCIHYAATLLCGPLGRRQEAELPVAQEAPKRPPLGRLAGAFAVGLLGIALVAGPWIAALSIKYGKPTYSLAGGPNHAITGPPDVTRDHPHMCGLWPAPQGTVTVWETPENLPYKNWSALENSTYFKWQLMIIGKNLWSVQRILSSYDILGASLAVLCGCPVLWVLLRGQKDERRRLIWTVGTVILYCSGYVLLVLEDRYLLPVIVPLLAIWMFHLVWRLAQFGAARDIAALRRPAMAVMGTVLTLSLTLPTLGATARDLLGTPANGRAIAAQLQRDGCRGPIAGTEVNPTMYVSFHMGQTCLGAPESTNVPDCLAELDRAGARTFMLWEDSPLYKSFAGPHWKEVKVESPGMPLRVFARQ